MRWLCLAGLIGVLISPLRADFEVLWSLGVRDGDPTDEFGDNSWEYNASPGSATARDNDFYFAGTYPSPIGTVPREPASNFEEGLDTGNLSVRLHFNLNASQARPTARIRLTMHQVWGGQLIELI